MSGLDLKKRFWKRAVWTLAILTVIPPLFGMVGTAIGMVRAFETMAEDGGGTPEALASDISTAISTTAIGLLFSVVFGLCLIGSAIRLALLTHSRS